MQADDGLLAGVATEIATARLYLENPFRILQVGVHERPRRIRRKLEDLEGALHMGDELYSGRLCMPPERAPTREVLRAAAERLEDGVRRIMLEFFWFWPDPSDVDGIVQMTKRQVAQRQRDWEVRRSGGDGIAVHNLAVLYHLYALDLENKARDDALTKDEQRIRLGAWRRAFSAWRESVSNMQVWDVLRSRITAMNDKRVRAEFVDEMRQRLPVMLLTINAGLAVQVAALGRVSALRRHLEIMDTWQDQSVHSLKSQALYAALDGARSRVSRACERLEQHLQTTRSIELQRVDEYISEIAEAVNLVRLILPVGDTVRSAVLDECGRLLSTAVVGFANKSQDWATSLALLQQAAPFAASATTIETIRAHEKLLLENHRQSLCFFCSTRPQSDASAVKLQLYGDVNRAGNTLRWKTATVPVPRCDHCRKQHGRTTAAGLIGCSPGVVVGIACMAVNPCFGAFMLAALSIAGLQIGQKVVQPKIRIKDESKAGEFWRVKQLLSQGFQMGARPPQ